MTLVPPDPPLQDESAPGPDVQQVVATRAEPAADDDPLVAFASRTRTVLGTAAGSFFSTVKWMLLLGLILSLGAAWWAAMRGGNHRDHSIPARFAFGDARRRTTNPST